MLKQINPERRLGFSFADLAENCADSGFAQLPFNLMNTQQLRGRYGVTSERLK